MSRYEDILQRDLNSKLMRRAWSNTNREEDEMHEGCIEWFDWKHPEYSLYLHHSPNEGKRSKRQGAQEKKMGMRKGFPDLIFLHPNSEHPFMAIEFKAEKGRLSKEQKQYREAIEKAHGVYFVIRTSTDFENVIEDYISKIPHADGT